MRLSRNRNWAHPVLLALIEKLAEDARAKDGWPGLLVGDISQPRGGPMLTGHASHQIGLDADIWLTPMPSHTLTAREREDMKPQEMVEEPQGARPVGVDRGACPPHQARRQLSGSDADLRPSADQEGAVRLGSGAARVACVAGQGPALLQSHLHFHVRIRCPRTSTTARISRCRSRRTARAAAPSSPIGTPKSLGRSCRRSARPKRPVRELMMSALPNECRAILSIK